MFRAEGAERIGVAELATICRWLETTMHEDGAAASARPGQRMIDWCEARAIDVDAMRQFGLDQSHTAIRELMRGNATMPELLAATAMVGFQLGIDAERRRRDGAELPS